MVSENEDEIEDHKEVNSIISFFDRRFTNNFKD